MKGAITDRQYQVLDYLKKVGVSGSGSDGSVLWALYRKQLVIPHFNSAPGYTYYTWTLSEKGKEVF